MRLVFYPLKFGILVLFGRFKTCKLPHHPNYLWHTNNNYASRQLNNVSIL